MSLKQCPDDVPDRASAEDNNDKLSENSNIVSTLAYKTSDSSDVITGSKTETNSKEETQSDIKPHALVENIFVTTVNPIETRRPRRKKSVTKKIVSSKFHFPESTLIEVGEKEVSDFSNSAHENSNRNTDDDEGTPMYIVVKQETHESPATTHNDSSDVIQKHTDDTDLCIFSNDVTENYTETTGTNNNVVSDLKFSVLRTVKKRKKRKGKITIKEPSEKMRKITHPTVLKISKKIMPLKKRRGRPPKWLKKQAISEEKEADDDVTQDFDDVSDVVSPAHQSQVVAPYLRWLSPAKMKEMFDSMCQVCYSVHLIPPAAGEEATCPLVDASKLTVIENYPESVLGHELPRELFLGYSRVYEDRLSLFACLKLPALTQFGPLKGRRVLPEELAKICLPDIDLDHFWPVRRTDVQFDDLVVDEYIETVDTSQSNFLRFLLPEHASALSAEDTSPIKANIQRVLKGDEIYFVTTRDIAMGEELFMRSLEPPEHIYFNLASMAACQVASPKKIEVLLRECTMCGGKLPEKFPFASVVRMVRHRRMMHTSLPAMCEIANIYQCNFCGQHFRGATFLRKHRLQAHLSLSTEGNVQCQYCKTYKKSMDNLTNHIASVHFVSSTHPVTCTRCGMTFTSYHKFSKHRTDVHAQVNQGRENKCNTCFKSFKNYAALTRHIRKVHEKKDFRVCESCGKSFKDHYQLKVHSLTHSGLKPFQCDQPGCTAAFTTKQWLQKHYRSSHSFTDDNMPPISRKVDFTGAAQSDTSATKSSPMKRPIFPSSEDNLMGETALKSSAPSTDHGNAIVHYSDIAIPRETHASENSSSRRKDTFKGGVPNAADSVLNMSVAPLSTHVNHAKKGKGNKTAQKSAQMIHPFVSNDPDQAHQATFDSTTPMFALPEQNPAVRYLVGQSAALAQEQNNMVSHSDVYDAGSYSNIHSYY